MTRDIKNQLPIRSGAAVAVHAMGFSARCSRKVRMSASIECSSSSMLSNLSSDCSRPTRKRRSSKKVCMETRIDTATIATKNLQSLSIPPPPPSGISIK
jgi:hypothetical protein